MSQRKLVGTVGGPYKPSPGNIVGPGVGKTPHFYNKNDYLTLKFYMEVNFFIPTFIGVRFGVHNCKLSPANIGAIGGGGNPNFTIYSRESQLYRRACMSVGLSEKHTNMIIFLQTSRPTAKASNGLFHSCFHIHCIFRCNCTKEGLSVHHTFFFNEPKMKENSWK